MVHNGGQVGQDCGTHLKCVLISTVSINTPTTPNCKLLIVGSLNPGWEDNGLPNNGLSRAVPAHRPRSPYDTAFL